MKKYGLVIAAMAVAGATAVSAQGISIGPGGIGIDVDRPERRQVIERRERGFERDRDDRVMMRSGRDVRTTGSVRCRTETVRRKDRFGRTVTERVRDCD